MKKAICTLLVFFAPVTVWSMSLEIAKELALEACSVNNRLHVLLLQGMLKNDALTPEMLKSQTKEEVRMKWEKYIHGVEDFIFQDARERKKTYVQVFTKDQPPSSREEWRKTGELYASLQNASLKAGIVLGFEELRGKKPADATIERVFIQRCELEVQNITRDWSDIEERGRQASERRWAEVDRKIDRLEKDERAEEMSRGAQLLGLGLGLMGNGGVGTSGSKSSASCHYTKDFVSGFHRTCYYQCPTGVVTSTVAAAEICPITRTAP